MFLMDMVMPISSCPLALPRLTKKSQSSYEWFSWKAGKMWGLVLTLKVEYCLPDRKSTRLNSSHLGISYAVFCLKKLERPEIVVLLERQQDIAEFCSVRFLHA